MPHALRERSTLCQAAALALKLGTSLVIMASALPARADEAAAANTAQPGVVQRVEGAVTHGAKAAASGIERGVKAAASGIERGAKAAASGVQRGVKAAAHGVEVGAKATAEVAGSVAGKVAGSSDSGASR
jgi:hypothetical protein